VLRVKWKHVKEKRKATKLVLLSNPGIKCYDTDGI